MLDSKDAASVLRAAGKRLTPQRRAVLQALEGNRTHPTVEAVAARVSSRIPGVSISTIYNTLHELAEAGLLLELRTPGALRFDPETAAHAHFVCDSCGTVTDIDIDSSLSDALARSAGIEDVSVMLSGVCLACRARPAGHPDARTY